MTATATATAAFKAALDLTLFAREAADRERPAIDLDPCEAGDHPEIEENPDGLPVCALCASLIVVSLSPPCRCGRGPVTHLLGYEASCVRCAADTLGVHLDELGAPA